jgi:hypothetical protein
LISLGGENSCEVIADPQTRRTAIGIVGHPAPDFASELVGPSALPRDDGLSLKTSYSTRRLGFRYSFLFMKADGLRLEEITDLIRDGVPRVIVDRVDSPQARPASRAAPTKPTGTKSR